jgi:hypothetical protein
MMVMMVVGWKVKGSEYLMGILVCDDMMIWGIDGFGI